MNTMILHYNLDITDSVYPLTQLRAVQETLSLIRPALTFVKKLQYFINITNDLHKSKQLKINSLKM